MDPRTLPRNALGIVSRPRRAAIVNSRIHFKTVGHRPANHQPVAQPDSRDFLTDLTDLVKERFSRLSGLTVVTIPLDLPGAVLPKGLPPKPVHPACAKFADTEYCRNAWQSHLVELQRRPEVHWHKCDFDLFCAIVPVLWEGRCLAVLKLVCPDSMAEAAFERNVELLEVLVESFLTHEADLLSKLVPREQLAADIAANPGAAGGKPAGNRSAHPQVLRALDHIERNLTDPNLTVGRIARELDINSTYLAHLFSEQIGRRMSRHISDLRMQLAKNLLTTTDWQIKRVAYESGYANPDWFSHVFHARAGLTPGQYRCKTRVS
jgi:AraC-like DNA-binding protein